LDKLSPDAEAGPEPGVVENIDIPKEQLDDIPF